MKLFFKIVFFIFIWIATVNMGPSLSQISSTALIGACEKSIRLFDLKPEKTIYNETGYTIYYSYEDKFPSKKAFLQLEHQLTECSWKQHDTLEFMVNDVDWTSYLKGRTDEETVVVHRFGKTYIDKSEKRLAVILIRYISKPSDIREAMRLDKPNNNIQLVTLQFMPFNEEEYKRVLDKYQRSAEP